MIAKRESAVEQRGEDREKQARVIRAEHVELGEHIGRLRELVSGATIEWNVLAQETLRLEANLTRHFAFEEENGYLPEARRTPAGEREAKRLLDEHRTLRTDLRKLRDSVERRESASVGKALESWLSALTRHERAESALMLKAVADEGAAG